MELSRYIFEPLRRDDEFILYRGHSRLEEQTSLLLLAPVATRPPIDTIRKVENEYSLRGELGDSWAVKPLTLSKYNGQTALVLEDPSGEPLNRLMHGPMEPRRFLQLAVGLATVLDQTHKQGLIHKDLKPANILMNSSTGQVRLTGFGIASRLPRERQNLKPPEVIAGTLAYMAPEQTGRMNRSIDSRSDLYALGVSLYEMLTGGLPFTASDPMGWIHCHIAHQPVPPSELMISVPAQLSAIVMKLLAKTGEERYQTAAGVEADLRRCLEGLESSGQINSFPLGAHDMSDRLLIPERLYGREREIDTLLAAFERVVTHGTTEFVLVSGYSGIGKSSVVNELHKVLVPPRGLFAAGKFDQYKRDIPYATLAQAFQSLVRALLSKSNAEVRPWKNALLEALGPNGRLMVNLIPELALIIGDPAPVPDLPPQDAQNRFQLVFRRFLSVFARAEHPFALFIDDLQWLDAATLDLIEHLVTHPDARHLLLVGAYRNNEVGPSHPLTRTLAMIRNAGGRVRETELAPLPPDSVGQLVADSLHCDRELAQPLAQLLHEKTGGNPFFAIQFLMALSEQALLVFDHATSAWIWNLPLIRAKGFTENVADLMAAKLGRLSETTRGALGQLACLGNIADIATLSLVYSETEDAVRSDLWEAVRANFVFVTDSGSYAFAHDRIQEAAYSLIPESERAAAHLRIGRLLASRSNPEELEESIFDIVNHFNRGIALITTRAERHQVLELNLRAGLRARKSAAYASARTFLAHAAELLPPDAWTQRFEETFDLYLAFSECEYLMGNFEAADALFDQILRKARSNLDRAKVHSLQMKLYQVAGKYDEGCAVAMNALRDFDIALPESTADIEAAISAESGDIPSNLGSRAISELLEAPAATDPAMRAVIDLLGEAMICFYIGRPELYPLVTLKAVNVSLCHGHTDQSSYVYGNYAVMLIWLGEISAAVQFSEMSLELNEKFKNTRLQGKLLHVHGDHVNFWRRHIATDFPILEKAIQCCFDVGDHVFAGYLAFETLWQFIENGEALESVQTLSVKYADFARQSHNEAVYETIRLEQRFIASLQGEATVPLSFDDGKFDEAACFAAIEEANFGCGIVFYNIMRQILAFLDGRYEEALDFAIRTEPVLGAVMSMPIEATYQFFFALTLTALFPTASAKQQQDYRRTLEAKLKKFELWAHHCPENYRNRHALVSAEFLRLEGRDFEAMHAYEEAIRSARDHGFIQNQGISYELAARFYSMRGFEQIAHTYLQEARYCYQRWGAGGKVRQLEQANPQLNEGRPIAGPTSTIETPLEHLDLAAIIKVSQAISSELILDRLIDTLMRKAMEHAGAERCLLVIPCGDELRIEAESTTRGNNTIVSMRGTTTLQGAMPESILRYVIRTHESVILDDASSANPFSEDPCFLTYRIRSTLCLPLLNQAKLSGVLYLENNLAPRVFTPERITVLRVLVSQAAISLENTRLYRDLEDREGKIRRLVDANILGITTWNVAGAVLASNEAFLRLVQYDHEDVAAGRVRWWDMTPAEWRERVESSLAEVVRTGTVQPFESEFLRKDGSRVPVLIGATLFKEGGNDGVAFVLDLSEQKRAEAEIRALKDQLYKENLALRDEIDRTSMFEEIVGISGSFKRVVERISKVAPTDSNVLVTGETGTGKELAARAIHRRSRRAKGPFVSVNCAATPRDLIASELFGHEKGAFTGATQRRLGRFELAAQGTIFLDEIGELPPETQVALLRVLQEREFERVGGTGVIRADVRVIAATNRDLKAEITAGRFRSDLFYRLNVFPIEMPPLRERKEDIPLLVRYFLDRFARNAGKSFESLSNRSLQLLQSYPWPGNIRELQNVIERSVIVSESDKFSVDESWLAERPQRAESGGGELSTTLVAQEKEMIEAALRESAGRVSGPSGAARKLGMPGSTLESKIKSLKINKNRYKA
jgi:PAS domain S-box-containing protein